MDHALFVRRIQRLGDLHCKRQDLAQGEFFEPMRWSSPPAFHDCSMARRCLPETSSNE